jgi:hypothetical protein
VPLVTIMEEGFNEFSLDFLVELDPTNPGADLYPIDIELTVTLTGNLILDIWSSDDTHETDGDDIPFIPEVGFINPPDYTDNTPFHILPGIVPGNLGATVANGLAGIHIAIPDTWVITWDGFHTFDEHFDPYAGTPAPFTGSSGTGGFDGGSAAFLVTTLGPFSGALSHWQTALAASATYTDEQAADIIDDIANNTTIVVGDFADPILGTASGNTAGATITIDPDAGGFEWFVDSSPFNDAEYDGGGPPPADLTASSGDAFNKVDMLSFFAHEIGHILGFGHATTGVMQDTLPRGERHLPVADDVDPGPPPTGAPAGDDVAALMVEVADDAYAAGDAAPLPAIIAFESGGRTIQGTATLQIGDSAGVSAPAYEETETAARYALDTVGFGPVSDLPADEGAPARSAFRMEASDGYQSPGFDFDFGAGAGVAGSGIDWRAWAAAEWGGQLATFVATLPYAESSNFSDFLLRLNGSEAPAQGGTDASYDALGNSLLRGGKATKRASGWHI